MKIYSNFDSGNITLVSLDSPDNILLSIRKDVHADTSQWFYFRLTGKGENYQMKIINASECSYPEGWNHYQALASYNRRDWFRVPTHYDGKQLIITHQLQHDSAYYAYFTPYSYERHQDLIAHAQHSEYCKVETICHTVNQHEISLLTIGQPAPQKRSCWIIGRQHPGETMAEWFCEGLIHRLLNPADSLAKSLLEKAVFYIIPNINPDGSILGNLRANGAGINLNRQWHAPDKTTAPEVYFTQQKMKETGVDFFFDVHGDEALPYVFMVDNRQNPHYTDRIAQLEKLFKDHYKIANPDFQDEKNYAIDEFPQAELLTMAPYAVTKMFDCLSFTLELPFIDNANLPDSKLGWSAPRSMQLGHDLLTPLAAIVDKLR